MLERLVENNYFEGISNDFTQTEKFKLQLLIKILKPFQIVTKLTQKMDISISDIIPLVVYLKNASNAYDKIDEFKHKCQIAIQSRLFKYITGDLYISATFLDPRYKINALKEEEIKYV
ncbi:hypothetical protein A3Q56_07446 [Intoshia linei]|uniref:Uncharacterized protein n=1 Tax=Intoshia linei TaxID=1819745 RepID=A0A177AS87_9BILA|nr:hypothetical protein A3Q56_07446 [Intoshia linei]